MTDRMADEPPFFSVSVTRPVTALVLRRDASNRLCDTFPATIVKCSAMCAATALSMPNCSSRCSARRAAAL